MTGDYFRRKKTAAKETEPIEVHYSYFTDI